MSEDLMALFRKTGALLDGHFILRSGLHSSEIDCVKSIATR